MQFTKPLESLLGISPRMHLKKKQDGFVTFVRKHMIVAPFISEYPPIMAEEHIILIISGIHDFPSEDQHIRDAILDLR